MPYVLRLFVLLLALYFLGVLVFRYILPAILKWWIKRKLKQRGFNFEDRSHEPHDKRKEGEIKIDHIKEPDEKKNEDDGDYIDYEDVK